MTTMKMPEKKAVAATAMFIMLASEAERGAHVGRDVERGLGDEPERQDAQNDAVEQSVVAPERCGDAGGSTYAQVLPGYGARRRISRASLTRRTTTMCQPE
jgi:hypothetical protein